MSKNDIRQPARFHTWTLAFIIFINDIFLCAKNSTFCNYDDDNTQFSCKKINLIK